MTFPICPCDADPVVLPTNPPQLAHINFRIGTWRDFRQAVLTPLDGEKTLSTDGLPVWRTQGQSDLAVMMAEWFAYLADILTFYNERIANQDYLRTADLPESVTRLIQLLGYRPRPAIGATGTLAALVTPGQTAILPKGLQFQSKPGPGQAPQTFELSADTPIGAPDKVPAIPPPHLLNEIDVGFHAFVAMRRARFGLGGGIHVGGGLHFGGGGGTIHVGGSVEYGLRLQGAVTTIDPGALLILRPRDPSAGSPLLATVAQSSVQPAPSGGQQTALTLSLSGSPPSGLSAAQASLERANQTIGLWSFFGGAVNGSSVHLASLARQIRPGAWVTLTAPGLAALLVQVTATSDVIWDATGTEAAPQTPASSNSPVPIPHTVLTLDPTPGASWQSDPAAVSVLFDWVSVGKLIDQPFTAWSGVPTALIAAGATPFPATSGATVLLQDTGGAGVVTSASSGGDTQVQLGSLPSPVPPLNPPFGVLYNPLAVTRGKSIANEVLGSGDATNPGQSFVLSQSPVTYLAQGATYASTISLTVNGEPWREVASFYGQPSDAQVFVTSEDESGQTRVTFGDGVNGARLPTGVNNVVATYRIGAGAASPPAGKLTVIAKSFPGLRAILNPVAVGGGADPDPPDQIRRYAPRSVLTFGRAVSVFDYEALAAQAPGVSRARAVWAWDDDRQRTLVTVYVGDDAAAATSAASVLAAAGDPNRPVKVVQASAVDAALALTLIVTPGMDPQAIAAQATAALVDPQVGLFAANNLPVGQPVFDSQIEAAVLSVDGAVAIASADFAIGGADDPGPLHDPGEGGYFALAAADITIVTEPDPHG